MIDKKQKCFENYEVTDPVRIGKALKFIQKYFKEIKGLNILECGITKDGVCDGLIKNGANCFGIDINPRKLEGVKIIQADLNKGIPEFGIQFDVIFAGEVMEHLYDDRKFIRELRNILKPGGILIITVPNLVSWQNRFLMFLGSMPSVAYTAAEFHYHVYTRSKLKNLLTEERLEVLKTTSSYLFNAPKISLIEKFYAILGDIFQTLGTQLIIFAKKKSI
jgi:2-polyprenyl-3-methyl-5-hydroxy-6-metoxy-1,4-benzoquinol methylase